MITYMMLLVMGTNTDLTLMSTFNQPCNVNYREVGRNSTGWFPILTQPVVTFIWHWNTT